MAATNDVTGVTTTTATTATTPGVIGAATTAVVTTAVTVTAAAITAATAAATTTTTHVTTHCSQISMWEYEFMSVDKECSSGLSVLAHILGYHVFHVGFFLFDVVIWFFCHVILGVPCVIVPFTLWFTTS